MYQIDERVSAIKEVQRLLGLNQTGIYDAATRKRVKAVQEAYSLKKNDFVDYETFVAICQEYRKGLKIHNSYLYAPKYPYKAGDMDTNVSLIHSALSPVLEDYRYEGLIPNGTFLGKNTIAAVNYLRNIFGIPDSEEIDELFINRLLFEKRALEIKRKLG